MSLPHGAVGSSAVYAIVVFPGHVYQLLFEQNKWRTDSKVAPKTYVVGNQKNCLNPYKPTIDGILTFKNMINFVLRWA